MIHLPDASFTGAAERKPQLRHQHQPGEGSKVTSPAVMRPLRFDAAAFGALVDDLSRLQLEALHELLGGVALWNCTLQQQHAAV